MMLTASLPPSSAENLKLAALSAEYPVLPLLAE
jgi:hypothetical protein